MSAQIVHIVDDDAAARVSLAMLLQAYDYATALYETPSAFLDAVPRLSDGCVLLEVRMRDMDGWAVQAHLTRCSKDLPVIMMTSRSDVDTALRAFKSGAVDLLEKPFDEETLLPAIHAATQRFKA